MTVFRTLARWVVDLSTVNHHRSEHGVYADDADGAGTWVRGAADDGASASTSGGLTGVVLNLTAVHESVPIGSYAPQWTIEEWIRTLSTAFAFALGTQWVLVKLVRMRRAQQGWWYYLKQSRHARLILPPECVTEAPMRSPLNRVTRKINKYIKKKGGPLGRMSSGMDAYSPILSVDTEALAEDAMPLLVFVNSKSGGQMGNYLVQT
jgi:hypothetical protein